MTERETAEETLRSLARAAIGVRRLGDNEAADELTRLHTKIARSVAEREAHHGSR